MSTMMYKLLANPVKKLLTWLLIIIGNEIESGEVPEHITFSLWPKAVDCELEERYQSEFLSEEDTSTTLL